MYEALHDNSETPASASLMRSQGRGRGRWGEWWRGGVGSNPRRVMKFGLQTWALRGEVSAPFAAGGLYGNASGSNLARVMKFRIA